MVRGNKQLAMNTIYHTWVAGKTAKSFSRKKSENQFS